MFDRTDGIRFSHSRAGAGRRQRPKRPGTGIHHPDCRRWQGIRYARAWFIASAVLVRKSSRNKKNWRATLANEPEQESPRSSRVVRRVADRPKRGYSCAMSHRVFWATLAQLAGIKYAGGWCSGFVSGPGFRPLAFRGLYETIGLMRGRVLASIALALQRRERGRLRWSPASLAVFFGRARR